MRGKKNHESAVRFRTVRRIIAKMTSGCVSRPGPFRNRLAGTDADWNGAVGWACRAGKARFFFSPRVGPGPLDRPAPLLMSD